MQMDIEREDLSVEEGLAPSLPDARPGFRRIEGVPIWGTEVDEGALRQILTCKRDADWVAMMADHHKGYAVPIGGVVAYEGRISPSGIGYDVGCGNKAVLTDMPGSELRSSIKPIMDAVVDRISFGMGRKNKKRVDHALFDDPAWSISALNPKAKDKAESQLGTVGGGNHYVDVFTDEMDRVWVGVHFGSRGLGHGIATYYLKEGGAKQGMDAEPLVLDVNSDLGAEYLQGMQLALRFAYAGRDWVCAQVAQILGAKILDEVHNNHNDARLEEHHGRNLWVVRKGATPAFPGQRGFVGGTMGDKAVIIEGVESAEGKDSLYSTVHGAGRAMSRTRAAGKLDRRTGHRLTRGEISQEMMTEYLKRKGVELRGADVDEAPQAYKKIGDVLNCHQNSIKILHTLRPVGVAMAGPDIVDPWKD